MLLVFDLDGTLVDSIHDLASAASELSARYGGPPIDDEAACWMVGEGAAVLVERVMAQAAQAAPPAVALQEFLALYDQRMFETTRPYPGTIETLQALAATHALALLTNKPEDSGRRILARLGLEPYFPHAVFGDGRFAPKPDPAGLQWLMERCGATAGRTLLIGDSDVDVRTARNGGVRLCLARYGFGFVRVDESMQRSDDWYLDQPSDLLTLLPQ
ncbi:MAG TPA: HAD-IA family hydrolase [Vicinamibacterales bacterium]|nr:HAD-IA family hydrolase [Vicinamibacterales bacterium]HOQ59520.1 HAD-IA family hydrolase [Vicinamibacterales bacterium]HPK70803.1 HAD-IA family hydrolase [Vicinamibacterales bacterium]HPW19297.1 HAD-IA family hydrolase [Vicinamibacterales bacterium]